MNLHKFPLITTAATLIVFALILASNASAQAQFKPLHSFTGQPDGASPQASLAFDQVGNLYGTTALGGTFGCGTVFQLTPNPDGGWTENIIHNFCEIQNDGYYPLAGLIIDHKGNLYGTTYHGGPEDSGTVFELSPNADGTWTETVLHTSVNIGDGAHSIANLVFDAIGDLYGTTSSNFPTGNGTVFQLIPNSDGTWTEKTLHQFNGNPDGSYPDSALIWDANGNLYGTTSTGGTGACQPYGCGTVFELSPSPDGSWTETVLYSFPGGKKGNGPNGLIFDATGNLYGTTFGGGPYGNGTVYELTPNSDGTWAAHSLHNFTGGNDGRDPMSTLIIDKNGDLYGTCEAGGLYASGTVFKLKPNKNGSWNEYVLYQFTGQGNAFPYAGLTFDTKGNLYGTGVGANSITPGVVFEITH